METSMESSKLTNDTFDHFSLPTGGVFIVSAPRSLVSQTRSLNKETSAVVNVICEKIRFTSRAKCIYSQVRDAKNATLGQEIIQDLITQLSDQIG
jgi:hypothetical protein